MPLVACVEEARDTAVTAAPVGPVAGSGQTVTRTPVQIGPPSGPNPAVPTPIGSAVRIESVPRVLPLGDSITFGTGVPGGYRFPLSQQLTKAGRPVDFVGTLTSNNPPDFTDPEHQGHVAWTVDDLIQFDGNGVSPDSSIEQILEATEPESILLHIGTNNMLLFDGWQFGAERVDELLDRIWSVDPEVKVFAATIVPTGDDSTNLTVDYFNEHLREFLWERQNDGFPVRLVDMGANLTEFSLSDGVHPSAEGYQDMADEWFAALLDPDQPVPAPPVSAPEITPLVAIASSVEGGSIAPLAVNGTGLEGDLHLAQLDDVPLGWRSTFFNQLVDSDGIGTPVAEGPQFAVRLPGLADIRSLRIWNGRNQTLDGEVFFNRESIRRVRVETSTQLPIWEDRGELVFTKGAGRLLAPYEAFNVSWNGVRAVRLTVLETYGNLAGDEGPIMNPVSLAELQLFGGPSQVQLIGSSF
ncbi:MAG: SGNH/GDSL hydrolase family protein [Planctomycetota bacterium]